MSRLPTLIGKQALVTTKPAKEVRAGNIWHDIKR
jgi:hypothetical protein